MRHQYSTKTIARFWQKVRKTEGCWIWTGAKNTSGYGMLYIFHRGVRAHRISFELHNGTLPDDACICHTCDNRLCVNPSHLFIGTIADNNTDMWNKGRGKIEWVPGERHGQHRLTTAAVAQIRALYASGTTQTALARRFGVTQACISNVVLRKSWRHV